MVMSRQASYENTIGGAQVPQSPNSGFRSQEGSFGARKYSYSNPYGLPFEGPPQQVAQSHPSRAQLIGQVPNNFQSETPLYAGSYQYQQQPPNASFYSSHRSPYLPQSPHQPSSPNPNHMKQQSPYYNYTAPTDNFPPFPSSQCPPIRPSPSASGSGTGGSLYSSAPASPSRTRWMRVSYADPSRPPVSSQGSSQRFYNPPYQGVPLRSISVIPNSARTADVTNASGSCLGMICPGFTFFSAVSFVSAVQIGVALTLHLWYAKVNPIIPFESFMRRGALIGVKVMSGQYYRMFSALFIHTSAWQLIVNIATQQQLGNILGSRFGSFLWLQVWFFCGIVGSLFGALANPTAQFVSVTAANLGPSGFHLSEVLLIMPQLQTSDLKRKGTISVIIALLQVFVLTTFAHTSLIANLVAFVLGVSIGIIYHRKGSQLPRWYGKARGFAVFVVVVLMGGLTIRCFLAGGFVPPFFVDR